MKSIMFGIIMFWGVNLFSYQYLVCLDRDLKWDHNTVGIGASHISFADANWRASLQTSIDRWNQAPSNFHYNLGTDTNGVRRGNGSNEIWFSSDPDALQGAPAIAYYWYECIDYWIFGKTVKMTETDIIFDVNEPYTPFMNNKAALWEYGGAYRPFQTTAVHELGHGLGLQHVNYAYNVMGQDWTHIHANGAPTRAYVGEDASRGAAHLYGSRNLIDLSVAQWKYGSASGEYSSHVRTRLMNASGVELSYSVVSGEKRYNVTPGQHVKAEFTFENNGSSTQVMTTGYYISTNDLITSIDRNIGEVGMTLAPDSVFVYSVEVVVPSDLPHGVDRWLGAIVDNHNTVTGEVSETNNATYIRFRTL